MPLQKAAYMDKEISRKSRVRSACNTCGTNAKVVKVAAL
jgi:hypothetical protein